jgi:hypothetical protein
MLTIEKVASRGDAAPLRDRKREQKHSRMHIRVYSISTLKSNQERGAYFSRQFKECNCSQSAATPFGVIPAKAGISENRETEKILNINAQKFFS